jgi:hypothetical protein
MAKADKWDRTEKGSIIKQKLLIEEFLRGWRCRKSKTQSFFLFLLFQCREI